MSETPTCPRCGGLIPSNDRPGAYPGAMSRKDNATVVCSACGTEEALRQMDGEDLSGEQWPVASDRRATA